MFKRLLVLFALFCSSISGIVLLYYDGLPDANVKGGFTRKFNGYQLEFVSSTYLDDNNYDLAGFSGGHAYLRNVDRPGMLLEVVDRNILKTIPITDNTKTLISVGEIQIDSPNFYVGDLRRYAILKGSIEDWSIKEIVDDSTFFSEYLPINQSASVVYRGFTDDRQEYRLIKKQGPIIDSATGKALLQKQVDGLFCTDGMLRIDNKTRTIVYVYFYRNEFIRVDTALNLIARNNTVDTISRVRIKVSKSADGTVSRLSSPPFTVNRAAVCDSGVLYICSKQMADNENPDDFRRFDVIDYYSLGNGQYLGSFYLPRIDQTRLRRFSIHADYCYVLTKNVLTVYRLRQKRVRASLSQQGS